jgi:hypothetical protein
MSPDHDPSCMVLSASPTVMPRPHLRQLAVDQERLGGRSDLTEAFEVARGLLGVGLVHE